jgi:hypothetical protein
LGIIDRNPLESGGKGIGGFAGIPDRRESFPDREALPVEMCFRFLLLGTCDSANCLIHGHDFCPTRKGVPFDEEGKAGMPFPSISLNYIPQSFWTLFSFWNK